MGEDPERSVQVGEVRERQAGRAGNGHQMGTTMTTQASSALSKAARVLRKCHGTPPHWTTSCGFVACWLLGLPSRGFCSSWTAVAAVDCVAAPRRLAARRLGINKGQEPGYEIRDGGGLGISNSTYIMQTSFLPLQETSIHNSYYLLPLYSEINHDKMNSNAKEEFHDSQEM